MADVGGADKRLIEVYPFDLAIGSQNLEQIALGLDDSGIVADADDDELRSGRQPLPDPLDERALTDIGNGGV